MTHENHPQHTERGGFLYGISRGIGELAGNAVLLGATVGTVVFAAIGLSAREFDDALAYPLDSDFE